MFGIPPGVWMAIGFAGQALFTARFLVQWLASEKKGESVVPVSFWWLSVVGSAILAVFAASRQDPVFLLGSLVNGFLYARNLILIYFTRTKPTSRRVLIPTVLALGAFLLYTAWGRLDPSIPTPWLVLGFVGAALWSGRFVIQWYASERAGRSVMPRAFWYVGLAGALLLLAYSVLRKEPVFILGYLFPPFPYVRNLVLIYRKEGAPALVRWGQRVWGDPPRRRIAIEVFAVLLALFLAARVSASRGPPGGFLRYHRAAKLTVSGDLAHLYDERFEAYEERDIPERSFESLPGVAVALAPLGLLPVRAAEVVWAWFNAFCFLMTLAVCWWFTRRYGVGAAWMWVPFLLALRFGWDNLNLGEIHPATVLCITGGVYLAEFGRRVRGGLLAGIAASIQPVLLLAGLVLVVRRRWSAVLGLALGVAAMALVIPAVLVGPGESRRLAEEFLAVEELPLLDAPQNAASSGESLRAMCDRLLGPVSFRKTGEVLDVSAGALSEDGSAWVYRALAVALLAWLLATAWRRGRRSQAPAVWGMALCVCLLLEPEARKAHFLMLMLPATAVVMILVKRGMAGTRSRLILGLIVLAFALAAIPARGIVGEKTALYFSAFCAVGFATLSLLVACALALRLARAAARQPAGPSVDSGRPAGTV